MLSPDDEVLYEKVARKILSETLHMRKGETLTIETWSNGLPFARRLLVEARRPGVIPAVLFEDEEAYIEGVKVTPKDVLGTMGKHEQGLLAGSDAYVFIPGPPIGAYSPRLSRQEVSDSTKYNASWYDAAKRAGLRGARLPFGYVGKEYARLYKKRPEEFMHHQLKAGTRGLCRPLGCRKAIGRMMQDGSRVTVETGGGRTLEFTLKGELEVEDGIVDDADVAAGLNMTYIPPAYVMKEVDPVSANGRVAISPSVTRLGLLNDAELEFERGRLAKWKSRDSAKMLDELVQALPPEKRLLSLVFVGLNPMVKYEFGQDRMVAGAVSLGGFGFSGVLRKGSLSVAGRPVVQKGKIASST